MDLTGSLAQDSPLTLSQRRTARQQEMAEALKYYTGEVTPPLLRRVGEPDDNLIISLGRLIVDKGVSFLFGQEVAWQVGEDEDGPSAAQDWLDECWRQNKKALTLAKWATNGGIFGHAFLRILDSRPFPRLVVLDPRMVEVVTDPDDIDTLWRLTITPPAAYLDAQDEEESEPVRRRTLLQSQHGQAGARLDLAALGQDEQWTIIDQEWQGGAWMTVQTAPWPYPFCPVVHCQNLPRSNDFWGESDIPRDVQHILASINRVASHYNKIIRLHAYPKIWTRGMGARTISAGIDEVISLPSETAELKSLEMQSDLSSTLALLNKLLNLLAMMVRIPLVAMGEPDNLGAISGVALQIRYQPLVEKTASKRESYGEALVEVNRRLLAMGGQGRQVVTTLHWREMLPADPLMERQVAVIDEQLGLVSKETLADKFGYAWADEQQRIQDEQAAERAANTAAGLNPDGTTPPGPAGTPTVTPAPGGARGQATATVAPLQPQAPDQARTSKSV